MAADEGLRLLTNYCESRCVKIHRVHVPVGLCVTCPKIDARDVGHTVQILQQVSLSYCLGRVHSPLYGFVP